MNVDQIPEAIAFRTSRGRRVSLLEPGTPERQQAEMISDLRAAGTTVREISDSVHLSTATIRRLLNRLELTRAVESGTMDKRIRELCREAGIKPPVVHRIPKPREATPRKASARTKPAPKPATARARKAS